MKCKRSILPLMGSTFTPGAASEVIENIRMEDKELAEIAQAEAFYFSGHTKQCVRIVEKYLQSEDIMLRMSADILYTFANMTSGDTRAVQIARKDIRNSMKNAIQDNLEPEIQAACLFAVYAVCILIHIPPKEEYPLLKDYLRYLPRGQRLFAFHMLAHAAYLEKEYAKGQGIAQTVLAMPDQIYPIPFIYLNCLAAVCQINQKDSHGARESVIKAWEIARKDKFLEPFIEYHGLLQGVLEVWAKNGEVKCYKKLMKEISEFGHGWRKIHNPEMQKTVTDLLTPMEFSIAMLACRDWTNKEIAEHMCLSVNTIKHYVSIILGKLGIEKRDEIKDFVNQ